jgi:nucleotide-binding universal stress UspA family protein
MHTTATVLVATDFSPHARHAADRAARLAHETHAALTLMHVLPGEALARLRDWLGAASPPEAQMAGEARRHLDELAQALHQRHQVTAHTREVAGAVIDELLAHAEAVDASLLVFGARGAGVLRRLVIGSTAERLVRRTSRPVLVVRHLAHEPYRRALVALDFSPWSARALAQARRVAPHARLVLLTVFEVPFEDKLRFAGVEAPTIDAYRQHARAQATQRLHATASAAGLAPSQWEPCVVEGEAWMRIVEKELELDCDLVVLGKHGQSAAQELLLGSVTRQVLAEGSADVLVSTARDA